MTTVDIVIPVYNEEHVLRQSVETLRGFLQSRDDFPYQWRIVVADNASRDRTLDVARQLAGEYAEVTFIHLPQKGRGRALRQAWLGSQADIVCYMDVDLSTSLDHLPPLIHAIAEEGYDLSTGSRLAPGNQTKRSPKREFISRIYNLIVKAAFFTKFSDAQCGFKAASRRAVEELVPLIEDQAWFFDSELLILGEKLGYRIKDIPVAWNEDPDTRVKIVGTAYEDLRGLARMRVRPFPKPKPWAGRTSPTSAAQVSVEAAWTVDRPAPGDHAPNVGSTADTGEVVAVVKPTGTPAG